MECYFDQVHVSPRRNRYKIHGPVIAVLSDRLQGLVGVEPPLMVWSGGKKSWGDVRVEIIVRLLSKP